MPVHKRAQPWTFGVYEVTNRGHDTVTLDRVTLLHSRHEHLISSWAMPGAALIGVPTEPGCEPLRAAVSGLTARPHWLSPGSAGRAATMWMCRTWSGSR
jgi:hypothetical protein